MEVERGRVLSTRDVNPEPCLLSELNRDGVSAWFGTVPKAGFWIFFTQCSLEPGSWDILVRSVLPPDKPACCIAQPDVPCVSTSSAIQLVLLSSSGPIPFITGLCSMSGKGSSGTHGSVTTRADWGGHIDSSDTHSGNLTTESVIY